MEGLALKGFDDDPTAPTKSSKNMFFSCLSSRRSKPMALRSGNRKLSFENDSVLVVSGADYNSCNTPDSSTSSADLRHCRSGHKLIFRVMHPLEAESPELAPSPSPSAAGGDDGLAPPSASSSATLALVSGYLTAFAALFTVCYFFVSLGILDHELLLRFCSIDSNLDF